MNPSEFTAGMYVKTKPGVTPAALGIVRYQMLPTESGLPYELWGIETGFPVWARCQPDKVVHLTEAEYIAAGGYIPQVKLWTMDDTETTLSSWHSLNVGDYVEYRIGDTVIHSGYIRHIQHSQRRMYTVPGEWEQSKASAGQVIHIPSTVLCLEEIYRSETVKHSIVIVSDERQLTPIEGGIGISDPEYVHVIGASILRATPLAERPKAVYVCIECGVTTSNPFQECQVCGGF